MYTATSVSGSTLQDSLNIVCVLVSFLQAVLSLLVRLEFDLALALRPRPERLTAAVIRLFSAFSMLHRDQTHRRQNSETIKMNITLFKQHAYCSKEEKQGQGTSKVTRRIET